MKKFLCVFAFILSMVVPSHAIDLYGQLYENGLWYIPDDGILEIRKNREYNLTYTFKMGDREIIVERNNDDSLNFIKYEIQLNEIDPEFNNSADDLFKEISYGNFDEGFLRVSHNGNTIIDYYLLPDNPDRFYTKIIYSTIVEDAEIISPKQFVEYIEKNHTEVYFPKRDLKKVNGSLFFKDRYETIAVIPIEVGAVIVHKSEHFASIVEGMKKFKDRKKK